MSDIPNSAECDVCHEVSDRCWFLYRNGELVGATCQWCKEQQDIEEFLKTGELTTTLVEASGLHRYEQERVDQYIAGERRKGSSPYGEWAWHLCTMRNCPPQQIPETSWSAYKRHMSKALDLAPNRHSPAAEHLHVSLDSNPKWVGSGLETVWGAGDEKAALVRVINHHIDEAFRLGIYGPSGEPIMQPRAYTRADASRLRIWERVKEFEREVWFGGLQAFIRPEPVKGHRADGDGFTFLSFCMCGRCRMQIETVDEGSWVVVQTAEDEMESRMGLHGIRATEEVALDLIDRVIATWKGGQLKMNRSESVGLG